MTIAAVIVIGSTLFMQDVDMLKAIHDVYENNRSSMPHGVVEFEYIDGQADGWEAALAGRYREAITARGFYVFDAENARYSRQFQPEDAASQVVKLSSVQYSFRTFSVELLTNHKLTIMETSTPRGPRPQDVIIGYRSAAGSDSFFKYVMVPLELGKPAHLRHDLGRNLANALNKASDHQVVEVNENTEMMNQKNLISLTIQSKDGVTKYWIDLEHGAIPVRASGTSSNGRTDEMFYRDVRRTKSGGYLPHDMLLTFADTRFQRLLIKHADLEHAPASDRFQMRLERPMPFPNPNEGGTFKARQVWDLNKLPARSEVGPAIQAAGQDPAATAPFELPGERRSSPPYFLMGAACLSLVALAVAWWFSIRRSSRKLEDSRP